jgi:hypothetical protein
MKKLLAFIILLIAPCAWATTTVTGTLQNLGTGTVGQGAFVRFWLRGCGGNQPRINGTAIIAPSQGGVFFFDFAANGSGSISGTLYSTRDSTGLLGGDITCGVSTTSVWYGMQVFVGGKGGPEVAVHAKNGVTLNISSVTPITTNPVVASPTGDGTYFRLDGGNSPITGPYTTTNNNTHSGTETFTNPIVGSITGNAGGLTGPSTNTGTQTFTGDLLAKSGRPWFDVMAFGAKNDNATDDTAAMQAAVTAACATTYKGGTIYFPPGVGYKSANTNVSPITISCDNLTFLGAGYSTINSPTTAPSRILCPACTVPIITDGGTQRFGFQVRGLGLSGNGASATSTGISLGTNVGDYIIERNFFDTFGGPCLFTGVGGFGGRLLYNFAQNCLLVRPAAVDTGAFDIGNSDTQAIGNFVTPSIPTAAGNIGTGHTYAWAWRVTNGFASGNMGEISQHGWLVSGANNRMIGNRCFLAQGNCMNVTGAGNIISSWEMLGSSQTATNTFSAAVVSSGQNIFSDNLIDDTASGNGNHTKNGFDDSNSNGAGDPVGNKYSNNKFGSGGVLGVLYNMTGASPYAIQQPHRQSGDRGDASVTVQCGVDAETQVFLTPLGANRTVTFSTTGAWNGCHFRVVRTEVATGAFNLSTVTGGSNATLSIAGEFADVEFLQSVWRVTGMGFTAPITPTQTIASGTASMTTAGILTGACGTTVTVAATGVATTDIINVTRNAAATIGNGGGLTLNAWPTAGNVNFNYCNSSAGTITPTAMTVNWSVVR